MSADKFESLLRTLLDRRPFRPFTVEMEGGQTIVIDDPQAVAFGGGAAGFIGVSDVFLIDCKDVREVRQASAETAS